MCGSNFGDPVGRGHTDNVGSDRCSGGLRSDHLDHFVELISRTRVCDGRTSGVGNSVLEQVEVGADTAYVENDPVTGQPLMLRTSSGIQALYVYAGTGSPVALLTDFASQAYAYSYDPYGVAVLTQSSGGNGEVQNPFLFQGGIKDRATGWVHFGARWYNPSTGRWTQQDTLDAPLDPTNANRYAFAGNDPINNIDPTGRASCSQVGFRHRGHRGSRRTSGRSGNRRTRSSRWRGWFRGRPGRLAVRGARSFRRREMPVSAEFRGTDASGEQDGATCF